MEPEPEPIEDPLPLLRAQLDQALALAKEVARAYRAYFDAFTDAGFTGQQALYLSAVQMHQDPGQAP